MPDKELYPPTAFHFTVGFSGKGKGMDASFQEVSGIGGEIETEAVREGGENRFVHMLPKGVKQTRLTLKRGLASTSSPLVAWCKDVLEGGLGTAIETRQLDLTLLDEDGDPLRRWSFTNAYPVRWEVESFSSMKNEIAVEKIDLFYTVSTREM